MNNVTEKINELIRDDDFTVYVESVLSGSKVKQGSLEDLSGNINRVKRLSISLTTGDTSLIVKHVPEAGRLAGYPTLFFSSDRLDFDYQWLTTAATTLNKENGQGLKIPVIFHYDSLNRTMIMEDLGRKSLSETLPGFRDATAALVDLLTKAGSELAHIHTRAGALARKTCNKAAADNRPYLFSYHIKEPDLVSSIWQDNVDAGIGIDERRELQAAFLRTHQSKVEPILDRLSSNFSKKDKRAKVYCHGDLHTGSVILFEENQNRSLAIIDAEFCDQGPPGFDPGVLTAHLMAELLVLGYSKTDTRNILTALPAAYIQSLDDFPSPKEDLEQEILLYTGAELLRRLLGPAGFNRTLSREQFEELLERATELLTRPESQAGDYLHG